MDGYGSQRDDVIVERLWRSVKYEEVYLRAYDSVAETRCGVATAHTNYPLGSMSDEIVC
jgi:putative transposase